MGLVVIKIIVCPIHMVNLNNENHQLSCPICEYVAAQSDDGSVFFDANFENSPDYDVGGLDVLYQAERHHFWFKNRVNIIRNMFKKYISDDKHVIEIGAGTGGVARALIKEGYRVAVGELYPKGLDYARNYGIMERYQFNIYHPPFMGHFDVCCMFDVLEHLDDDYITLKNVGTMLKKDGFIILTVPAHSWLWSKDDIAAKHKRRYEQQDLMNLVENAGFTVLEAKNFFFFILPLLYLRTILKKDKDGKNQNVKLGNIEINPIINTILDVTTRIENVICSNLRPTLGGSIILIARKKDEHTL